MEITTGESPGVVPALGLALLVAALLVAAVITSVPARGTLLLRHGTMAVMDGTTAAAYVDFAEHEARGVSPTYERLALAVAVDDSLIALLDSVPTNKRQPNLLFGIVRLL